MLCSSSIDTMKLSLLSIVLGLGLAVPQVYGLAKPNSFAAAAKAFGLAKP